MQFTDQRIIFYSIKTPNGLQGRYTNNFLAEQAKATLPVDEQQSAYIVQVNADGKEILLG